MVERNQGSATVDILDKLHGLLAANMIEQLKEQGTSASPQLLSAISKFLRDNKISVDTSDDVDFQDLRDQLSKSRGLKLVQKASGEL